MAGGGGKEKIVNGCGVSFRADKTVLELDRGDGCTTLRMY